MTIFCAVINGWVDSVHETFAEAQDAALATTGNAPWSKAVDVTNEGLREAMWTAGVGNYVEVVERRVKVKKPMASDSMMGVVMRPALPTKAEYGPGGNWRGETTDIHNRNPEGAEPPEGWTSPHGLRKVRT